MQHSAAVHQEHLEKARLRHKHAMARVKIEKVLNISYCICVAMSYKNNARLCVYEQPHLPYKTGLDVMQSQSLCRTRFGQYQASSAALG